MHLLEILAEADPDHGLSPTEAAAKLGVHRSIAARLLATLLRRGFVRRNREGRYLLGMGLFTLARQVSQNLLVVAGPLLTEIAERLDATAVMHVADGDGAVTLASVEPKRASFHIGLRTGSRHPLGTAATGIAILAGPAAPPARPAGQRHGAAGRPVLRRVLPDLGGAVPAADAATVTFWTLVGAALGALPVALLQDRILPAEATGWLNLAAQALIAFASQLLIARALRTLNAGFSAVAGYGQPVVATLLAWPILGQVPQAAALVGSVFIIAGIALAGRGEAEPARPARACTAEPAAGR